MTAANWIRRYVSWKRFWWCAFLAILLSHLYFSYKIFELRWETKAFELIHKVVPRDANRLTVSNVPLDTPGQWQFFAEKPPGRKFVVCAITEDIDRWPRTDQVTRSLVQPYSWRSTGNSPTVRIEHPSFRVDVYLQQGPNGTSLRGGMLQGLLPADHPLHLRRLDELQVETLSSPPTADQSDVPQLLLRITDPQTPARGLVVWIEDRPPDPVSGL